MPAAYTGPADPIKENKVADIIEFSQIPANSPCNLPPQPPGSTSLPTGFDSTNICSIELGSSAVITDYVYSLNSVVPTIDEKLLPQSLQGKMADCNGDNSCSFIGYDFDTEVSTIVPSTPYIVSTQTTISTNQAVLEKPKATSIAFIRVVNGGSGYSASALPNIVIGAPTGGGAVQALATAEVSNGIVKKIKLDNGGAGYTEIPTISIDPPPAASGGQQAVLSVELLKTPILATPPGYRFYVDPLSGNPISPPSTVSTVDLCAKNCDQNPNCKGFNYNGIDKLCRLYDSASVEIGPTYDQADGASSFISEKYISTAHGDEQTGIIRTTTGGSVPNGTDFTNQGSYCQNILQCNADIKSLVESTGVQSFTTDDIQSCQYCPVRGFDKTSLTVTNEVGVGRTASSPGDAIQKLIFTKTDTPKTYVPISGVYSIAKWINDPYDKIPNQTVYIAPNGIGVVNNYNGVLGKNLWFDVAEVNEGWVLYQDPVYGNYNPDNGNFLIRTYTTLSNMVNNTTDIFNVLPVDYITNGYIFFANGGHVNSKVTSGYKGNTYENVPSREAGNSETVKTICPKGGSIKYNTGDYNSVLQVCSGVFKDPLPPKYSEKYNKAVYILAPTLSIHQFFAPFITSKTYYHDKLEDVYYKISFSAPNCTQDYLVTMAADAQVTPQNYNDGRGVISQVIVTIATPVPLLPGDRVLVGSLLNAFTVTSVGGSGQVTLECPKQDEHPTTIPNGTRITWFFIKTKFDPAHDNIMFAWYQEIDNKQWTEISAFDDLIFSCIDGGTMPDPYDKFDVFRTLPNTKISSTGQTHIYDARQGCNKGCSSGKYLLYNCYVNSGAFYSSCDTHSNGAAQRGPICADTYNSCTPDLYTQLNTLAKQFTGLKAVDNIITSKERGNPKSDLLTTPTSPNYTNLDNITMSTTYVQTQTTALSLSPEEKKNFPNWMHARLGTQTVNDIQTQIEGSAGCTAGYGRVTLNQVRMCQRCEAGTYSPGGTSSCLPCADGTYCPYGSSTSTLCQGGHFCTTPASQEMCSAGYYCPPGTVTPLLCADAITPTTIQTTVLTTLPASGIPSGPIPIQLANQAAVQPLYIINIVGMLTALKAVTPTTFTQLTPMTYASIGIGANVKIQTKALYCPAGTSDSSPPRCTDGYRCPDPSQQLMCNPGQYCSSGGHGVYEGQGCPADQYYYPPSLRSITAIAVVAGQLNTASVQCARCPADTTDGVNDDQTGCICKNPATMTWSRVENKCIRNCPAGQTPNPTSDNLCQLCPAGTYIDTASTGHVSSCMTCATNFVSSASADRTTCICSKTRSTGSTLQNGSTQWCARLNRCKVICDTGYRPFYSACFPNVKDATPATSSQTVTYDCDIGYLLREHYVDGYKCNKNNHEESLPYRASCPNGLTAVTYYTYVWTGFNLDNASATCRATVNQRIRTGTSDLPVNTFLQAMTVDEAARRICPSPCYDYDFGTYSCVFNGISDNCKTCPSLPTMNNRQIATNISVKNTDFSFSAPDNLVGYQFGDGYTVYVVRYRYDSGRTSFKPSVNGYCTVYYFADIYNASTNALVTTHSYIHQMCASCYTESGGTCVFTGTATNSYSSCYTCNSETIDGASYDLYNSNPRYDSTLGKVVCDILGTLPQNPSLWGKDGALDDIPNNCTDITDPNCQLPPKLVNALKQNFSGAMSARRAPSTRSSRGTPASTISTPNVESFQCPAGFRCVDGLRSTSRIFPCTAGNFCALDTPMSLCPEGYYCPGELAPLACSSTEGENGCQSGCIRPIPCDQGNYCPETGSITQTACPVGYYCPSPREKVPCPAGTYSGTTGITSVTECQNCTAGNYCPEGSSTQTPCTAGNYCLANSVSQNQCPVGHYCSTSSTPPKKCPPGIQCPAGTATNYDLLCTGNQRPDPTYTSCVTCQPPPPGAIYKNQSGCDIVKCTGRTQSNAGKTSCDACPTRKSGYIWGSAQGCSEIRCPVGMVPSASGTTCK